MIRKSKPNSKKSNAGRPRSEIDFDTLQRCCQVGCTREECAGILRIAPATLDERLKEQGTNFQEYFKNHFDKTKQSLRRAQIKSALEKKNPTMQIWLGKQYLGQRDKWEHSGQIDSNQITANLDPSNLTDDELDHFRSLLKKCSKADDKNGSG